MINLQDYDYKVKYVKGKDNASTDFLSRKDDCDKTLIPNSENLTAKIFRKDFHPAGATGRRLNHTRYTPSSGHTAHGN
uniref:Uncharacterized protein n=1 Tax=Romanomermis culicivorax TaxID=13658 RepID=A0A915JXH9_ROMCU